MHMVFTILCGDHLQNNGKFNMNFFQQRNRCQKECWEHYCWHYVRLLKPMF